MKSYGLYFAPNMVQRRILCDKIRDPFVHQAQVNVPCCVDGHVITRRLDGASTEHSIYGPADVEPQIFNVVNGQLAFYSKSAVEKNMKYARRDGRTPQRKLPIWTAWNGYTSQERAAFAGVVAKGFTMGRTGFEDSISDVNVTLRTAGNAQIVNTGSDSILPFSEVYWWYPQCTIDSPATQWHPKFGISSSAYLPVTVGMQLTSMQIMLAAACAGMMDDVKGGMSADKLHTKLDTLSATSGIELRYMAMDLLQIVEELIRLDADADDAKLLSYKRIGALFRSHYIGRSLTMARSGETFELLLSV